MALVRVNDDPSGYERWEEPDRSQVQFRAPGARFAIRCQAYKTGTLRKHIGAKITTVGDDFDAARIDAQYWKWAGGYWALESGADEQFDDNDLYESQGGFILGPFPSKVVALCRMQFRGHRMTALVSKGELTYNAEAFAPPYPSGYPPNWPANGTVTVDPLSIKLTAAPGRMARGSVEVKNTMATPANVRIGGIGRPFTVEIGNVVLPVGESVRIGVSFIPRAHRSASGSFAVEGGGRSHRVSVAGTVREDTRGEDF